MNLDRRSLMTAALAAATLTSGMFDVAIAQAYPDKTITLVVSYPPGGDTDAMARIFAEKLAARVKQTVIVENRAGASGTVGNTLVLRSKPDGYTLLFTPNTITTATTVLKIDAASSYDAVGGFEPVIMTNLQSLLLVANADSGIKTVKDLVDKAKSGKSFTYGSPGAGSPMHIAAEMLNRAADIKVTHVPYRGTGPMIPDLLAGRVDMGYTTIGPVAQHIASGKLVAVALTDGEQSPLIPGLKTVAEQGYPSVKEGAWHGIMAPKGTPAPIIAMLNAHMNEILKMPDVVQRMHSFGAQPIGGAPELLTKTNTGDYARLTKAIADLKITAD